MDDAIALPHLFNAHAISIVDIPVLSLRNGKMIFVIAGIGFCLSDIPVYPGTSQTRAAQSIINGIFSRNNADANGAFFPYEILRQEGFIFIEPCGKLDRKSVV